MKKLLIIITAIAVLTTINPGTARETRYRIITPVSHDIIRITEAGFRLFQDASFDNPAIGPQFRTYYRTHLTNLPPIYVSSSMTEFTANLYQVTNDEIYATEPLDEWRFFIAQNPHDGCWTIGRNCVTYYALSPRSPDSGPIGWYNNKFSLEPQPYPVAYWLR